MLDALLLPFAVTALVAWAAYHVGKAHGHAEAEDDEAWRAQHVPRSMR